MKIWLSRIAQALVIGLGIDVLLVWGTLTYLATDSDVVEIQEVALGVAILIAISIAMALRRTIGAVIRYFLFRNRTTNLVTQQMRLAEYPKDVFASDWSSYIFEVASKGDQSTKVSVNLAASNGEIQGMKQVSPLAGFLFEHLLDEAVRRYLA